MTYKRIWFGAVVSLIGMASLWLVPESSVAMLVGALIFIIGMVITIVGAFTARPSDEELASDRLAVLRAIAATDSLKKNTDQT